MKIMRAILHKLFPKEPAEQEGLQIFEHSWITERTPIKKEIMDAFRGMTLWSEQTGRVQLLFSLGVYDQLMDLFNRTTGFVNPPIRLLLRWTAVSGKDIGHLNLRNAYVHSVKADAKTGLITVNFVGIPDF